LPDEAVTFVLIVRIPAHGITAFQEYEARVLPLLAEHGGVLQRRLRDDSGATEIHLIRFPSVAHFDRYRADPGRAAHAHLMVASQAETELLRMRDVS
jgi:uncharacterized protein (DUF1330 family)